ncbi:MAG: ligand-binding protein SH3 [Candidatus Buchananbacteria bacterium CG10_big_fil_rev_8_21_14_0_10_42_9]|uniref:Ligand-binding protein SH3 n=1 Tax=Candidatus Buchananbacteria bacterium CG10_big_fil_rev_8_21_14_0_10_42_9 TaxID=1974526 RepID=A0A2H0W258_9BACT|nr:MAG: ligand-binding protein SH3 [Candidatus Buchananbacteria bacterium CG10_big_fil_rev_8_21_14_0_10_42_9]
MVDALIETLANLPPQLAVFIISMVPIAELRVSIPVALGVYKLPIWEAVLFSVLGDILIALLIIRYIGPLSQWLRQKSKFFKKLFDWWFSRAIKRMDNKLDVWGPLALMLFVGVPLPVTGAWTGATASWLFKIPRKIAAVFISAGVLMAAFIVTLISLGVFSFF